MIVVVDYEIGNIGSIINMVKKVGGHAVCSSDKDEIKDADKLILAGVGSFDTGVINLENKNLIPLLEEKVLDDKIPILGICLGMQLMTKGSEEGNLPGLGWIDAQTVRFNFKLKNQKYKIPHMGWNGAKIVREGSLFKDMYPDARFYFVHSYYVDCKHKEDIVAITNYGFDFVSSFQKNNIMGTQFHPEKSHKYGLKLIKNFVEMGQY